jgi:transposase
MLRAPRGVIKPFWDAQLRGAYKRCILPTKETFPEQHTRSTFTLSSFLFRASQWSGKVETPSNLSSPSVPGLVRSLVEPGAPQGGSKRQRRDNVSFVKTQDDVRSDAEPTRKGDKGKKEVRGNLRMYKIRMRPNVNHKKVLISWHEGYNWMYNTTVDALRGVTELVSWTDMKKKLSSEKMIPESASWVRNVPAHIRAQGVILACNAHNNGIRTRKPFELKHRSLEDNPISTIQIDRAQKKDKGPINSFKRLSGDSRNPKKRSALMFLAPRAAPGLGGIPIRDRNWLINRLVRKNKLEHEGKIMWDRETNSWYLLVVLDIQIEKGTSLNPDTARVCATDPGERNFMMFYGPDGTYGRVIPEMRAHIEAILKRLEWLRKRVKEMKEKRIGDVAEMNPDRVRTRKHRRTIQHLERRAAKVSRKFQNRRLNGHYGAINFLLDSYDVVLFPPLAVSSIIKGNTLSDKVKKSLLAMAHFKFRKCLESKAQMREGKLVHLMQEPYTSLTCGNCGNLKTKEELKGADTYVCGLCKVVIDRDVNGARNNLLATFTRANMA